MTEKENVAEKSEISLAEQERIEERESKWMKPCWRKQMNWQNVLFEDETELDYRYE